MLAVNLTRLALIERGEATSRRLVELALGSFLYASIFLVEAGGLWHQKRWAEYLTVFVTTSLLPFEILAVTHEQTIPRVLMLGLNLVVIIYLVWRLWARKSLDAGIGNR